MQKTTNYQLNQWDAQDAIKRTDFNADNAKIDAAIQTVEQNAASALATEVSARKSAVSAEASARTSAVTAAKQEAANALAAYKTTNDAAVENLSAEMPKVYAGSYVGDGTSSRVIQLPFAPKFALMLGMVSGNYRVVILTPEDNFFINGTLRNQNLSDNTKLVGDTFCIKSEHYNNQNGETMYYFLFR